MKPATGGALENPQWPGRFNPPGFDSLKLKKMAVLKGHGASNTNDMNHDTLIGLWQDPYYTWFVK